MKESDVTGLPRNVEDSGVRVEAKDFHHHTFPNRVPGQHMWIVLSMFRVDPTADRAFLDRENLLSIEGPGCFWCERSYTPEIAAKPCVTATPPDHALPDFR